MIFFKNLNFCLAIIFLSVLLFSFHFYYQYGDDFIFLNLLREKSVFETILYKYQFWDGRHLSLGGLLQMVGFAYLGTFPSLVLGLFFLSISIWIFLKMLVGAFDLKQFLIILTLFLIGLFPFYKDVVFWQTGIIYLYFFFQSVLTIYLYRENIFDVRSFLMTGIILVLSLNSQNFNLAVLIYVWTYDYFKEEFNFFDQNRVVFTLLVLLSTIIISLAPGNFIRIEKGSESVPQLSNIFNLTMIYLKALNYCKYFLLTGLVAGLLLIPRFKSQLSSEFWALSLAGFFSLAPFILYPDLARIRVFFLMGAFLFFLGIIIGVFFQSKFNKNHLILSPILIFGIVILVNQTVLLKKHSDKILMRHDSLLKSAGKEIAYFQKIDRNYDLFIIRSPDYTKEWNGDFLEYYSIGDFSHAQ